MAGTDFSHLTSEELIKGIQALKIPDYIRSKSYGVDVRETLAQMTEMLMQLAYNQGMNPQEAQDFVYRINNKINKGEVTLNDLAQDVKEAMTGGSVAVVGLKSIGVPQFSTDIQADITKYEAVPYDILTGKHYRIENGVAVEYSHPNYHSAILNTSYGWEYRLNTQTGSQNQWGVIYIDNDFNVIESYLKGLAGATLIEDYMTAAPEGATKVIFSVHLDPEIYLKIELMSYNSIATKEYVSDFLSSEKPYENKKIAFLGDSITDNNYNAGLSIRYPSYVASKLGATEINYGISGSTIAVNPNKPTEREPLVTRFQEMANNADVVIVFAGTNDCMHEWSPIGTFESRDNETFYGALHNLCLGLKKKFKNKPIMFMTPIMRRQGVLQNSNDVNGLDKSIKDYGNIIKEVCDYYSIPVLDLYGESGLYPFDEELAIEYYNQQGSVGNYYYTHPNSNGQKMIGNRLHGFLKQLI